MTGQDRNSRTDDYRQGSTKVVLEDLCRSCGVETVDVISPLKIKELEALIKQRLAEESLSVIIAREPCRLVQNRILPRPEYDKSKCKTCGICLSIDCPGVIKKDDGYVEIDEELCTGCNLCVEVCPPKALRKHE